MPRQSGRHEDRAKWALQDAKNKFSEVVSAAARGEPQVVTRRGVETAVIISHEEFEKLSGTHGGTRGSIADCLLGMPTAESGGVDRIELTPRDLDE